MQNFLADYGALIAPIAAIINGFIAVIVAQFFKDRAAAKVLLVVTAGLLGAAAIGATVLSQRQFLATKTAEQLRQKEIRETIGRFISEGSVLAATCTDNATPPNWPNVNSWIAKIKDFLENRLGPSYATRLTSAAGVPVNIVCRGADEAHNNFFRVVNAVNIHLEQFSSELAPRP